MCPPLPQLGVPVVKVWLLEGGVLEPVSTDASAEPALMMVHYKDQYYLQPVGSGPPAAGMANSIIPTSHPVLQQVTSTHP